ncbi:D-glycerate dehydrogenase [Pigmentiphaga sp.]|uniref:2-hydroxyacid dehydrogenase n=1 Tax=Pigmentiphaga sp. TaxID=1977564 RepID=UPI00128D03A5|nr:D-glycerate dehydrogenase [Pigmentiphaga sp.]MPS26445.1 D-glycerate dehydrogenase [Alcaligenaceae bacterium SAGV5]MPS52254.1 D-glycerate dehydrogenase [Alcaligenaceae bacterium SAGV3]MPT58027.1 D-glycerate dehydrogenase [Alcaligenaceae bacterium]
MPQSPPTVIVCAPVPPDLRAAIEAVCRIVDIPTGLRLDEAVSAADRAVARGVLCTVRTPVDAATLDALPAVSVVSNFAVGYDNIDVPHATRGGVLVCNTPGVLDRAVADLTMGFVLCLARDMVKGDAFVRQGAWLRGPAPLTSDLAGKTLGLLGMGRIGRMVARRAQAFDMRVVYHNRSRDMPSEDEGLAAYRSRDELLAESDFLSVHVPLSAETRGSVGEREFEAMKRSAYLINTSRGPVVDEAALIRALQEDRIAGAGLDVMEREPVGPASPLCALPNVVLQAHAGSATVETRRAMMELAVANLLDALEGRQPRAMVNPPVRGGMGAAHA